MLRLEGEYLDIETKEWWVEKIAFILITLYDI